VDENSTPHATDKAINKNCIKVMFYPFVAVNQWA